jgi:hypothetical protein
MAHSKKLISRNKLERKRISLQTNNSKPDHKDAL